MYALALASQKGAANFAEISQIADGINHAIPTHKELQSALKWLCNNLMVEKQGSGYVLTSKGSALVASTQDQNETTLKVWGALEQTLALIMGNVQTE